MLNKQISEVIDLSCFVTNKNDNNMLEGYNHLSSDRLEDDNSMLNTTGGV